MPWPVTVDDLTLRYATDADIDQLLSFRNDPDVNRFTIATHVDPEEFRATCRAASTSDTDYSCAVVLNGRAVALGYLELTDDALHPQTPAGAEALIGYIIDPRFSGRGIASTLCRELLRACFELLGLRRVRAYCFRDNPASVRVLEKAGMRREQHDVADTWHSELGWVDGYGYAMLADEWLAGQVTTHTSPCPLHEIRDASGTPELTRPLPPRVTGRSWPRRSMRLELAPATEDDLHQMLGYLNRPEVRRWMLQASVDLDFLRKVWLTRSDTKHSFVGKLGGRVIGSCNVDVVDGFGQPGGPLKHRQAWIGYSIDPDVSGQGLGRELAAAGLDVAFGIPGVRRVLAGLYAGNVRSAHLLDSLGLRREQHGVRDSWLPELGWTDGATYAILDREWRPDQDPDAQGS